MARVSGFLIRYFSNYYTLHRSDLAARAAPLDPRLILTETFSMNIEIRFFFSSGIRTNSFIEFSIEIILSDFGIFIHSLMNARSILKV